MTKLLSITALAMLLGVSAASAKQVIRHHQGHTWYYADPSAEQGGARLHSEPLYVWGAHIYYY
jgi:hypothetical protein